MSRTRGSRSSGRRLGLLLAPALVAACACTLARRGNAEPPRQPVRRAFLVGINTYSPDPDGTSRPTGSALADPAARRQWRDLRGAAGDAEAMALLLKRRFGFRDDSVVLLKNQAATRGAILEGLRSHLIDAAMPGDVCVFYYAGHGSQVRNSRSSEPDGLDETLVPADSHLGAPDIRDKELEKLFNDILDRGALLSVILDSCHSTSIQRGVSLDGVVRAIAPDLSDVATGAGVSTTVDVRGDPVERGALILAAAQDYQKAMEITDETGSHGVFTRSLLKVLRTARSGEPAEQLFARLRAQNRLDLRRQEPSLLGTAARRAASLFGHASGEKMDEITLAVLEKSPTDCTVEGGLALGLFPGSRLRRVAATDPAHPSTDAILEVSANEGVTRVRARVVIGDLNNVAVGDMFQVDMWAAPVRPMVSLYVPSALGTRRDVSTLGRQLATTEDSRHEWRPLPPFRSLETALVSRLKRIGAVIKIVTDSTEAQYVLAGRVAGSDLDYAWVLREAQSNGEPAASILPVRTSWINCDNSENAVSDLVAQARGLARVSGWHVLESPPDNGRFPYRLALRNRTTKEFLNEGDRIEEGDRVDLLLTANPVELDRGVERRYVYVFVIDSSGQTNVLYPRGGGNIENYLPPRNADVPPTQIALRSCQVVPPFGVDTYFLLSTVQPLASTSVLDGVPATQRAGLDALSLLLSSLGGDTTRSVVTTPSTWSVERRRVRSHPQVTSTNSTR